MLIPADCIARIVYIQEPDNLNTTKAYLHLLKKCLNNYTARHLLCTFVAHYYHPFHTTNNMSISELFKKIFSRMLVGNCLGIIVTTLLLGTAAYIFIDYYTHHGEEITVPNVCGLDENVAMNKLKALGLHMEVTDTGFIYNAAPFSVLEQSIKEGVKVKPGRTIYLTINANGPRLIALPDVADNCSRREAEDKLRILGFKLGATEYVMGDPEWVYGIKVNGKNVPAGTRISITQPITLVVGVGGNEDEYNGNDSLDFILNNPDEEEIIEGEEAPAKQKEEPAEDPFA